MVVYATPGPNVNSFQVFEIMILLLEAQSNQERLARATRYASGDIEDTDWRRMAPSHTGYCTVAQRVYCQHTYEIEP